MITIACSHCPKSHEVYWYVQKNSKTACYDCDRFPRQTFNPVDGRPEIHYMRQRCFLSSWDFGQLTPEDKAMMRVEESKGLLKANSNKLQTHLPL